MTNSVITRRQWLFGACCLSLGTVSCGTAKTIAPGAIDTEPYPRNADEALARLQQGNQRFMADKPYHTHLLIVLGHEGCGAVTATVEEMLDKPKEPEHIESLIKSIKPGLSKLDLKQERESLLRAAVEANVRWSMQQLLALPEAKKVLREKSVTLLGSVYELNTGRVRFPD